MESEIQRILAKRRQRLNASQNSQSETQVIQYKFPNPMKSMNTQQSQNTGVSNADPKYYIPPQVYQQDQEVNKSGYQFKSKGQLPNYKTQYQTEIDEIKKQALIEQLQQTQNIGLKSSQSNIQDQLNELIGLSSQTPGAASTDLYINDINQGDCLGNQNIYNIDNHFKNQISVNQASQYMSDHKTNAIPGSNVFMHKSQKNDQQQNQNIEEELNQLLSAEENDVFKSKSMLLQVMERKQVQQNEEDLNDELDLLINPVQTSEIGNVETADELQPQTEEAESQKTNQIDVDQFINNTLSQKKGPFEIPDYNPTIPLYQPTQLIYKTESDLDKYVKEQIEKNRNIYSNPLQPGPRDYDILNAQESLINKNMLMQLIQ